MISKEFWNLENRPHTKLKLQILSEYLPAWATIIYNQYKENRYENYKTVYYIDCFAGRGMFHEGSHKDYHKGSPILGITALLNIKNRYLDEYQISISPKCILIEHDKRLSKELELFIKPYEDLIEIELYQNTDCNNVINKIVENTGFSPAFFFVDPGGIKELKSATIRSIVSKKGAKDIMINYIKGGPSRIGGLAKKVLTGLRPMTEQNLRTIKTLEDFHGVSIYGNLDRTEKQKLASWIKEFIEFNNSVSDPKNKLETVVFDMPYPNKKDNIYYLLFASRKNSAKNIMKEIFKKAKKKEHSGQLNLGLDLEGEFEIE